MVIKLRHRFKEYGALMTEIVVAMAIILVAMLPMGDSVINEAKLFRANYQRAIAMEIVDGEMEILADGAARNYSDGSQIYPVHSRAFDVLPPGHFQLTKTGKHLRLEWMPDTRHGIGVIAREATLP